MVDPRSLYYGANIIMRKGITREQLKLSGLASREYYPGKICKVCRADASGWIELIGSPYYFPPWFFDPISEDSPVDNSDKPTVLLSDFLFDNN